MQKLRTLTNIFFFLGLSFGIYGQNLTDIKSSLKNITINDNDTLKSGQYYYSSDKSDIKKLKKEILNIVLPQYDFYSVYLIGYLGWHNISSDCLILLNPTSGELKIIEPIWNNEISSELIEMIIGYNFENDEELKLLIFELQEVLLIGSKHNKDFKNTIFGQNKITFDLYDSYKEERLWRKIEIGIENDSIKYFSSTNPKTGKKLLIN